MQLRALIDVMEEIAPTRYAEPWDNVGLLVGDPGQPVSRVMLTIDYTPAVAAEAAGHGCDAVVAYHPPIFKPIKRVTSSGPTSAVFDAVRRGVALYSPHTALDVAEGGTNDVLGDIVGLIDRWPLKLAEGLTSQYKLVTFVPVDALEKVSQAIFAAGAGHIGHYSACSFRTQGMGTFFGEAGSNPTVGQAGRLEVAPEIKVETVVPTARVQDVIRALRQAHPYEEPAFDLNVLAAVPEGVGIGRVGELPQPTARRAVIDRIKQGLGLDHVLVAGPTDGDVRRVAVCAGSCGDLLDNALAAGVDLYLTGELKHHDALKAALAGVTVVCTLHTNSERATLQKVAETISRRLPDLPVLLSQADRDPFAIR
jgi:dinuclear metal center YbgI/SA1388 family protein